MLDMKRINVDELETTMDKMTGRLITVVFERNDKMGEVPYENFKFMKGKDGTDYYYGSQDDVILEHRLLLENIKEIQTFEGAWFEEQIVINLMNGGKIIFQHA